MKNQEDPALTDGTASQSEWIQIANRIREEIDKRVTDIAKMSGGELYDFLRGVREAHFLEVNARTFDSAILEKEKGFS